MTWTFQDAKRRVEDVVRQALEEGPQTISWPGHGKMVVVSADEYRRLKGLPDFKQFLLSAPDLDGLDLRRDRSLPRNVDLT